MIPDPMTRKELNAHVKIDAWAQQCVTRHRRECPEKICGGRQKIWWILRHPNCHPKISNRVAREYVINKLHCCQPLLDRLAEPTGIDQDASSMTTVEDGFLPWLPGEFNVYVNRSAEEISILIGREGFSEEPEEVEEIPAEKLSDPFPAVRKSFPKSRGEATRESFLAGKSEQRRRRTDRTEPATGLASVTDALSNRQSGR